MDSYRREAASKRRVFEWKENGRSYRLVCRENAVGGFIFCSIMDVDGKRHRLFFLEGKGLIKGWALLAEVLRGLDTKTNTEEKRQYREAKIQRKEEYSRGGPSHDLSFAEATKNGGVKRDTVWLDVSDCMPRGELGTLKYCLVRSWKMQPTPFRRCKSWKSRPRWFGG